ncbi:hypothetical protein CK203_045288 [Vitis vinifera]|uniref:Uncharacterized protein n=1 Tax=Vitis vinifera TaxID=29760 RepID=A0A438HIC8_VITVI|nr:hypothetical protein CK203_045288 [Vitis vinifera]
MFSCCWVFSGANALLLKLLEIQRGLSKLRYITKKDKGVKINDDLRKKLGKKWNALSKVEKEDFMAKSKESSSKVISSDSMLTRASD